MRNILTLLVILTLLGLSSCKKDKGSNDPSICAGTWAQQVMDEVDAMSTALSAYISDPSQENCIAYKNALQDYVDALDPYLECSAWTAEQRAELQSELEDSEDQISQLCTE